MRLSSTIYSVNAIYKIENTIVNISKKEKSISKNRPFNLCNVTDQKIFRIKHDFIFVQIKNEIRNVQY